MVVLVMKFVKKYSSYSKIKVISIIKKIFP